MSSLVTSPGAPPLAASRKRLLEPQQGILAIFIVLEVLVFSIIGTNFLSRANAFELARLSVDLGLLALALTPVIVTGGIDLSVGSLLGLCAILFGKMWRDGHMSPASAALCAIAIGAVAGCLNAGLITRLRIPPLIVTLGTFSLFRGIAEGITGGVDNFTHFPPGFMRLGNGNVGPLPTQFIVFLVAMIGFWVLLHWSTIGRALSAIGYSPEGARYAGLPVERSIALTYVLAGLCSGIAAVIYASRVGQAKADAGTGYELAAITAVVLGGTSIFGGRGSILGTLLGLFAITILQNGLRLAAPPPELSHIITPELSGIVTGLLLLLSICMDWRLLPKRASASASATSEELDMKNSQLAVLSIVILAAALIVAGGNFWLVRSLERDGIGRTVSNGSTASAGAGAINKPSAQVTVAMMPKSKGNAYFIACRKGAEEAAKELNVQLLWDGPTDPDPAKQNEIVETWITRGVDVIAVAVENRAGISTALRKAREKGIKVLTWDSDAEPDARDFFVNQATAEGIGFTLMDNAARVMGNKGDFAIITASLTAANMNEWRKYIEQRRSEKYPDIHLITTEPCDDKQPEAFNRASTILNHYPDVKLIMAICSPAVPGAAEAVKQSGRNDVKVLGLGLPNDNKSYIHQGITDDIVLWNTMDLGYLTVVAAHDLKTGALKPGDTSMQGGRLGKIEIAGSEIRLGKPFTFTKENVDQFDF